MEFWECLKASLYQSCAFMRHLVFFILCFTLKQGHESLQLKQRMQKNRFMKKFFYRIFFTEIYLINLYRTWTAGVRWRGLKYWSIFLFDFQQNRTGRVQFCWLPTSNILMAARFGSLPSLLCQMQVGFAQKSPQRLDTIVAHRNSLRCWSAWLLSSHLDSVLHFLLPLLGALYNSEDRGSSEPGPLELEGQMAEAVVSHHTLGQSSDSGV